MSVEVNAANFPDEKFRNFILGYGYIMPSGSTLLTDESIAKCKTLSMAGKGISNLKGIEYFTELRTLYCYSNQLASLNLSNNRALISLDCADNPLTELNVSENGALKTLRCDDCKLTSLDITKNVQLESLSCRSNLLTSLDVSKNPKLRTISIYENMISTLDLSKNTELEGTTLDEQWIYSGVDVVTELKDDGDEYSFTNKLDIKKIVGAGNVSRVSIPENWGYTYKNGVIVHIGRIAKSRLEYSAEATYVKASTNVYMKITKSDAGYYFHSGLGEAAQSPTTEGNLYTYNYDTRSSRSSLSLPVRIVLDPYMPMAILPKAKIGERYNAPIVIVRVSNVNGEKYPNIYIPSNRDVNIPTTPLKFEIVSGSLPSGLTLNATTGEISGTPK